MHSELAHQNFLSKPSLTLRSSSPVHHSPRPSRLCQNSLRQETHDTVVSALSEICKQIARPNRKGFRQLDDVLQRNVPFATFDPANIVAVQAGSFGQLLLRIAPLVAELPQPNAKSRLNGACRH